MRKGNHLFLQNSIYVNPSGLGNFIQVTPALQAVYQMTSRRVKVKKNHDYIYECFLDAPFIEWVENIGDYIPISYDEWDWKAQIPDYEYGFRQIVGAPYDSSFHTYVDTPSLPLVTRDPYIVLVNGGNAKNPRYLREKKMTEKMLSEFFEVVGDKTKVVFCGSQKDFDSTREIFQDLDKKVIPVLNNMRDALSHIRSAKFIVSNDTGLYHASCAMKKQVIVSDRVPTRRNHLPSICIQTPNKNATIVSEDDWHKTLCLAIKKSAL